MMKCEKVQDFILSDYLDEQLDSKRTLAVEKHLAQCEQCRELAQEVKEKVGPLLKEERRSSPPASLWSSIEKDIEARPAKSPQRFFWVCWKPSLRPWTPQWNPLWVFVLCLMIMAGVVRYQQQVRTVNKYLTEQVDFLALISWDDPLFYYLGELSPGAWWGSLWI